MNRSEPDAPFPAAAAAAESWDGAAAVALLVLVAIVFARALGFGFVYDDRWTLLDNPIIRAPDNLAQLWGRGLVRAGVPDAVRPLMLASEMLDWALGRAQPRGYHLQNLIWHGGVVLLLFAHLRRWGLRTSLALGAAALFAVHPLVVEPVVVINYREDLLAGFFVLLALWWAVPGASLGRSLAAGAAALLGALAKENALVAPLFLAALVAIPWQRRDSLRADLAAARGPLLALGGAGGLAFLWRWWATGGAALVSLTAEIPPDHQRRLWAVPRAALAFLQGVGQFLWPAGLAPEYPDWPPGALTSAIGWAGVTGVIALTAVAWWMRARTPQASLGWLLAVAAYLPNFGLVPLTNLRADRYLYLPALGLAITAGSLLPWALGRAARLPSHQLWWRRGLQGTWALVVLALAFRSIKQTRIWRDDVSVFSAAVAADPGSQRALIGLASAQLRQGRRLAALEAAERALALADAPRAREMRGLVLLSQGDGPRARQDLEQALAGARGPHRAQVLNNLGFAEIAAGDLGPARIHLAEAMRLDPRFDRPALQLARLAQQGGDLVEARALLAALLQRVPESIDGWRLLAEVERGAGRPEASRQAHERARVLAGANENLDGTKAKTPLGR